LVRRFFIMKYWIGICFRLYPFHVLKLEIFLKQDYRDRITIEPGKRGGKPCIRRMRITVYDILSWLAAGMSHAEIIDDFPELEEEDILAALQFAADRESKIIRQVA